MAGEIDWIFEALGSAAGQIRAGTIRPIVVTSAKRSPAFPDVPAAMESGLAGFEVTSWYGLWVPAGAPAAVVQKLNDAVVKTFADPELKAMWGKVVREAKVTLEYWMRGCFADASWFGKRQPPGMPSLHCRLTTNKTPEGTLPCTSPH